MTLIDERLKGLGYLPLTEGHTGTRGELLDDQVIGFLELYSQTKPMDKVYWADKVEAYEKLDNRKNENVKIYFIAGTGAACYKSIQNNNNAKGGNEPCFIQY